MKIVIVHPKSGKKINLSDYNITCENSNTEICGQTFSEYKEQNYCNPGCNNFHRVLSLISHLNYKELSNKILPREKLFTNKFVEQIGGKNPCASLAKILGPSEYGSLAEIIVEALIKSKYDVNKLEPIKESLEECGINKKLFKVDGWSPFAKVLKNHFEGQEKCISFQAEIADQKSGIVGHIDVIDDDTIYDIKTTGKFSKMRTATIFQLLSYYCLAKINNIKVSKIGLVLPLQSKIVVHNLEEWNWKPFYEKLVGCINQKLIKEELWKISGETELAFIFLLRMKVGSHVHINDVIEIAKSEIPAAQFFLGGNCNSKVEYTESFKSELKGVIQNYNSNLFIHAPYILNFSNPGTDNKKIRKDKNESLNWTFDCLRKILKFGIETGVKGVVIHCGKRCEKSYNEAVEIMRESIIACSKFATPECKILIETSAGQSGETLFNPEDFINFYKNLPENVRQVVGVCVDTCHVFAAGYKPSDFVLQLTENNVNIDLFHYNDCKDKIGSRKDRHACIGKGYIGYEELSFVMDFAIQNDIPMVTE